MDQNGQSQGVFSKITNIFRSNQRNPLMIWKQSGEKDEWRRKAVEAIVKKINSKDANQLNKLKNALATRSATSECVTIPRSVDGRLQVSNCKSLPHVITGRIWRWPDLQNHNELREIPNCKYPHSKAARSSDVCINPYHYERIENKSMLPPILVPRTNEFAPGFSKIPTQQMVAVPEAMPANAIYDNNKFSVSTNGYSTSSPCPSSSSGERSPINQFNGLPQQQQQHNFQHTADQQHNIQYPSLQHDNNAYGQSHAGAVVQVHYEEVEHWATVAYYELNNRVGEQYKCNTSSYSLIVDGFTQPSCKTTNRFCLGLLSNVSRNSTIEATRRHIGKGVSIYFINNELYLECLSDSPVFVQGLMLNYIHNYQSNTVLKVLPKQTFKIFDNNIFHNMLSEVVYSGFEETFKLTKMCTIRMSFVKGWGAQYHRQDVTSTPCWIELHLNGPLKLLDKTLIQMGSPLYNITSVS